MRSMGRMVTGLASVLLVSLAGAAPGWAQPRPLMRAVAMSGLIPSLVQQLAPIEVELPAGPTDISASKIKIVGLTWCGGDAAGGARALGVVYPEEAAAPAVNALAAADCDRALTAIAARLPISSAHAPWAVVVKIRATWKPWQLTLAMVDAAGVPSGANPAAALKGLGEFKSIATAGLQLLPPPADRYRFDIAIRFLPTTILAVLFPSGTVANPAASLAADPLLRAEMGSVPAGANLLADAQYGFINQLLRIYAPVYEVPLQIQGMNQPITVRKVVAAGGDNTMTLRGEIGYAGMSDNATMTAQGEDLRIATVTLDPVNAPDCNSSDMMARLQCEGQQLAATGSAGAIAAGLTNYYQGQPFHYSTGNRPLRFVLGDTEFAADLEALKSASHGATFSEAGRATIRRLGPSATR
ncbi:MAG TPA: hypothetical protein VMV15_09040 [Candidatus Binataceae bacterium]|nr:hypothetical protein [Candidatus Binataceae bacterium]